MLLEQLLERFVETKQAIAQLEASLQDLQAQILQRYEEGGLKEKIVGDCRYLRVERAFWKTPLEEARKLNATEMVEQLNRARLKLLYEQGVEIPGRTISAFIRVYGLKGLEL